MRLLSLLVITVSLGSGILAIPIDNAANVANDCMTTCTKSEDAPKQNSTTCKQICEPVKGEASPRKTLEVKEQPASESKPEGSSLPATTVPSPQFGRLILTLEKLSASVQKFNKSLKTWKSGVISGTKSTLKMRIASSQVTHDFGEALEAIEKCPKFTSEESAKLIATAGGMLPQFKESLESLVALKPEFDNAILGKVSITHAIADKLESQMAISNNLNEAIVSRLSPEYQKSVPAILQASQQHSNDVLNFFKNDPNKSIPHKLNKSLFGVAKKLKGIFGKIQGMIPGSARRKKNKQKKEQKAKSVAEHSVGNSTVSPPGQEYKKKHEDVKQPEQALQEKGAPGEVSSENNRGKEVVQAKSFANHSVGNSTVTLSGQEIEKKIGDVKQLEQTLQAKVAAKANNETNKAKNVVKGKGFAELFAADVAKPAIEQKLAKKLQDLKQIEQALQEKGVADKVDFGELSQLEEKASKEGAQSEKSSQSKDGAHSKEDGILAHVVAKGKDQKDCKLVVDSKHCK